MTDVTVNQDSSPQDQPGGARTPDGTLLDSQPTEKTPEPKNTTDGSTDGNGSTFLTSKQDQKAEADVKPSAEGDGKTDGDGKDGKTEAPVVPEKYADFKLPDGVKLDDATLKMATDTFKELGLTQEGAQKLVDIYAKNGLEAAQAPFKAWADLQKTWLADIGDRFGSRADAVRTDITKAIGTLPPSLSRAFTAALDLTGAGSHPDVVEALHILLKPHVEGGSVREGNISPQANKAPGEPSKPSPAEAMYPHLIPNRK